MDHIIIVGGLSSSSELLRLRVACSAIELAALQLTFHINIRNIYILQFVSDIRMT